MYIGSYTVCMLVMPLTCALMHTGSCTIQCVHTCRVLKIDRHVFGHHFLCRLYHSLEQIMIVLASQNSLLNPLYSCKWALTHKNNLQFCNIYYRMDLTLKSSQRTNLHCITCGHTHNGWDTFLKQETGICINLFVLFWLGICTMYWFLTNNLVLYTNTQIMLRERPKGCTRAPKEVS